MATPLAAVPNMAALVPDEPTVYELVRSMGRLSEQIDARFDRVDRQVGELARRVDSLPFVRKETHDLYALNIEKRIERNERELEETRRLARTRFNLLLAGVISLAASMLMLLVSRALG